MKLLQIPKLNWEPLSRKNLIHAFQNEKSLLLNFVSTDFYNSHQKILLRRFLTP